MLKMQFVQMKAREKVVVLMESESHGCEADKAIWEIDLVSSNNESAQRTAELKEGETATYFDE